MSLKRSSNSKSLSVGDIPTLKFNSFDHLAVRALVEGVPDYFRCHAEGCDHGHIHDDEDGRNNIWRCQNPACSARISMTFAKVEPARKKWRVWRPFVKSLCNTSAWNAATAFTSALVATT